MATRLGNKEIKLVSTNAELGEMLAELNNTRPNVISVDAEGWDISRDGTLSLLALSWNEGLIYVIDVQELGSHSFNRIENTALNSRWSSVKEILEDFTTLKLFCDPRSDSDALYHHYGVHLKNTFCVQLAEVGVRRQNGHTTRYVKGGKKITLEYGGLSGAEMVEWERLDREASKKFFPDKGGSYENLTNRPLSSLALKYSALGVLHLKKIYEKLEGRLGRRGKEWVKEESRKRVEEFRLPSYKQGKHRAIAPAHWGNTTRPRRHDFYEIDDEYYY